MPTRVAACFSAFVLPLLVAASALWGPSRVVQNASENAPKVKFWAERASPLDLEVSGNLAGLPSGAKRFVRREDLLVLPQVSFEVTDDPNFAEPVMVRGVELELLARELAADGEKAYIVAVCKDWYRGHYPQSYREIHRPVLVLEVNDQAPPNWPKHKFGASMAPYLITHANFVPAFKILAHEDEEQIPWGVIRLEFGTEDSVLGPIIPQGTNAGDPAVQAGFRIAQQNCFRCHGPERDAPLKGKLTWPGIALFSSQAPKNFAAFVRNPQALSKDSEMPSNPTYDAATLQALTAYFDTFASEGR